MATPKFSDSPRTPMTPKAWVCGPFWHRHNGEMNAKTVGVLSRKFPANPLLGGISGADNEPVTAMKPVRKQTGSDARTGSVVVTTFGVAKECAPPPLSLHHKTLKSSGGVYETRLDMISTKTGGGGDDREGMQ